MIFFCEGQWILDFSRPPMAVRHSGMMLNHHTKGLERQHLIGLAMTGLNDARTIKKASAMGFYAIPYEYNKGIGSPGSLVNHPDR